MSTYNLWSEGYLVTGMEGIPATAQYLGAYEADSYFEAVAKWGIEKNPNQEYGTLSYNPDTKFWSAWGCRIFDNESDARKSFG